MKILRIAALACAAALALSSCDLFTSAAERVARAEKFIAAGNDRAAAIELKNALDKEPGDAHAWLLLARISLRAGDPAAAEQDVERAIAGHAPAAETSVLIAEVRLAKNEPAKLLAALDDGSLKLNAPLASTYRGLALLAQKDRDGAIRAFNNAIGSGGAARRAHLGLAEVLAQGGEFDDALAQVESALRAAPEDADAWLAKGRLLARRGDFKQAGVALDTARRHAAGKLTAGDYGGLLASLVEARIANGDTKGAHATLGELANAAPDSPLVHLLTARVAMVEQDYSLAVTEAQKVVAAAPQLPLARLVLGSALMAGGNYNQAEVQLAELVRLAPENPEARKLLAEVNLRLKRPDVAMQVLTPLQQTQGDAQADALLGWVNLQRGDDAKAIELLKRGIDTQPDNPNLKLELALAYIGAGQQAEALELLRSLPASAGQAQRERLLIAAIAKGKPDDAARAEVGRIVKDFPKDVGVLNVAATFYAQQRDFARARELLGTARALDPKNVATLSTLARIESAAGDAGAVEKALRDVVDLDPANTSARVALARVALGRNDIKTAIAELEGARKADGRAVDPRLMLASLYLRAHDKANADGVLRELDVLADSDPAVALQVGRLYADAGRYDESLALFRTVVLRHPRDLNALLETGRVQLARGDLGGARDAIRKSLELDPDGVLANAMMVGIELKEGRTQEALACVARVRKAHPDNALAAMLDGEVNLSLRNADAAAQAYAASYAMTPTAGAAIRGFRARSMAKRADALAPLEDWLARQPRDVGARMILAQELQRQGKGRDAAAQYERIVTEGAPNALVLNNLAWLYHEAHDARALDTAKRAFDLAPSVPAIADTYGWILVESGRAADAVPILERVVAAPGATSEMRFHLAAARARNGQTDQARAELRRLLAGPAFAQADEARKLLADLGG